MRTDTARAAALGQLVVVVEGSPPYCGRLGFEPAAEYGLTLSPPSWAPAEAAQVLKLNDDPMPRRHVIYRSAFDTVSNQ